MPEENHIFESLPAYALGSLDEVERRLVAAHLAGCELCRTELAAFEEVVGQLAWSAPDAAPPTGLKERLNARIQSRPSLAASRPAIQRLAPVWGIVSLVLILALSVSSLLLWQRINRLEVLTGPQGMRAIALHNSDSAPQASGFVIISVDGQDGVLVVDALPQLGPEQQYQVWLLHDGDSTSGGVFSVDESGYRGLRLRAPQSLLWYSAVQVTIEPLDGSATPTGQPVLDGWLHNR
jgi:anti-sigma-K factor RskA